MVVCEETGTDTYCKMAAVSSEPTQLTLVSLSGDSLLALDALFRTRRAIGQCVWRTEEGVKA